MTINAEDVKTLLRTRLLSANANIPLISEGNTVNPSRDIWVLESFGEMELVHAADSVQLLKGRVVFTYMSRGTVSPAVAADAAAAVFDPGLAPASNTTIVVFTEKISRSGIASEHICRKAELTIYFTAALK